MNTNNNNTPELLEQPTSRAASRAVTLPNDRFKLFCWKVRNGSPVRQGETVALAMRKDKAMSDHHHPTTTTSSSSSAPQHKRPTKRRRPGTAPTENDMKLPDFKSDTSTQIPKQERVPILARADGIVRMGKRPHGVKDPLIIGFIEECRHETVIEGLCAVCGKPVKTKPTGDSGTANAQTGDSPPASSMSRVTVAGLTVSVSEKEGQRMAQQDAERLRKQRKLSLVLDLDHTLVHATNDVRARAHLQRDDVRSLLLPLMEEQQQQQPSNPAAAPRHHQLRMQHFAKLRPHVEEFLKTILPMYEIGVYTAGTRDYAEQITLILARHVVGATRDEIDLEQLRHRVAHAQAEFDRNKEKNTVAINSESEKAIAEEPEDSNANRRKRQKIRPEKDVPNADLTGVPIVDLTGDDTTAAESGDLDSSPSNDDEQVGKKRKRVTFGEPPASSKSDQISSDELDKLKKELEHAELLESRARDMRQQLFGSRVVTRTDVGDLGRDTKSLKRIFPCGGAMAAVVDDREDVWANAKEVNFARRRGEPPQNLLLVRPYHWDTFLGFADVNNAAGVDLSGGPLKEGEPNGQSEQDQQLLWISDILTRLHKRYYDYKGPDRPTVPEILVAMRREVLSGCKVVLSGLVPLHKQGLVPDSFKPRPNAVRYVEDLGAELLPSVTHSVTHVVAAKDGTDKIVNARSVRGCMIVKPSWLMECVWTLTRRDEQQHLLGPASKDESNSSLRPLADSKRENSSSSDEDDELAAEFESELMEVE